MGFLNNLTWRYFRMNLDIFTSDQHPETEEYSTWAFHSHVSLGNPRKERGIKRITNSEQLIKPTMSFLKSFRFKKSQHDPQRTASKGHKVSRGLATEHYREPQELQEPRRSMQITDYIDYSKRSLQQKTQSEEQVSEKAGLKYNIRDYYSYASLRNPFKEEESERVHSKFFTQPNLSRKQSQIDPQQPDFTLEKSKEFLRGLAAELNRVPQLLHHNKLKSEKAGVIYRFPRKSGKTSQDHQKNTELWLSTVMTVWKIHAKRGELKESLTQSTLLNQQCHLLNLSDLRRQKTYHRKSRLSGLGLKRCLKKQVIYRFPRKSGKTSQDHQPK
ncbi:hypothetical protein AMELA_G00094110 [Ameiurus melas]|uniref:Uncharacterized protein n=1 Tax=Ameiurus melas TaxID=219545 RepID=A0A7J6B0X7_AMEME|nr:hypothetical protein AMELA_G00094110 [Ameiurus melas]